MTPEEREKYRQCLKDAGEDVKHGKINPFWLCMGNSRKDQPISIVDFIARSIRHELYDGEERREGQRRANGTS